MPLGAMLWEDQTNKTITRRITEVGEKGLVAEVDFDGECKGTGRMAGMVARFAGTDKYAWNPAVDDVITGTAQGQMTFRSGEIVLFKAVGIGNQVSFPAAAQLNVLSLLNFINPHPIFLKKHASSLGRACRFEKWNSNRMGVRVDITETN